MSVGGYHHHSVHSATPDFMVFGLPDDRKIDMDQLLKIKILSGYDLLAIEPKMEPDDPSLGGLTLYFGHGYKKGAIKRIVMGETL